MRAASPRMKYAPTRSATGIALGRRRGRPAWVAGVRSVTFRWPSRQCPSVEQRPGNTLGERQTDTDSRVIECHQHQGGDDRGEEQGRRQASDAAADPATGL